MTIQRSDVMVLAAPKEECALCEQRRPINVIMIDIPSLGIALRLGTSSYCAGCTSKIIKALFGPKAPRHE